MIVLCSLLKLVLIFQLDIQDICQIQYNFKTLQEANKFVENYENIFEILRLSRRCFTRARRSHLVRCLLSYTLNSKKQRKKCQNLQNSRRFLLDRVSLLLVCVYNFRIKMNTKICFHCFFCL